MTLPALLPQRTPLVRKRKPVGKKATIDFPYLLKSDREPLPSSLSFPALPRSRRGGAKQQAAAAASESGKQGFHFLSSSSSQGTDQRRITPDLDPGSAAAVWISSGGSKRD